MRSAILLATTLLASCGAKPAPKVCSAEAPPAQGPVSIGMCTNDGPPAISDAGNDEAGALDEAGAPPPFDAGSASSAKSASAP